MNKLGEFLVELGLKPYANGHFPRGNYPSQAGLINILPIERVELIAKAADALGFQAVSDPSVAVDGYSGLRIATPFDPRDARRIFREMRKLETQSH